MPDLTPVSSSNEETATLPRDNHLPSRFSQESGESGSRLWHSFFIALISGVSAAGVGLYGTSEITFKQIEQPKLELEAKKTLLEAHRQILALSPRVDSACSSRRWNQYEWRLICSSKNLGTYPTSIRIKNVFLELASDPTRKAYREGTDYSVYFPKDKKAFMSPPGTGEGVLEFFVIFNKDRYPNGITFDGMQVMTEFQYEASKEAQSILSSAFVDQAKLVHEASVQPPELVPVSLSGVAIAPASTDQR